MNCDDYQKNFSKLMDNELGEEECASVFTHMGTCPTCREFFRTSMLIQSELDELRIPEPKGLANLRSLSNKTIPTRWRPFAFVQRFRDTRIPLSFATAAIIVAMAGTLAATSLWNRSEITSAQPSERDVYIHMLPAEEVQPRMNQTTQHR